MSPSIQEIAEAFSSHRFEVATPHLAPDVRWVSVGGAVLEGRDAVLEACAEADEWFAGVSSDFTRFLSVVGESAVAIDAIARYVEADGQTSHVSSCDIYEFADGTVTSITTYAVELPPS